MPYNIDSITFSYAIYAMNSYVRTVWHKIWMVENIDESGLGKF